MLLTFSRRRQIKAFDRFHGAYYEKTGSFETMLKSIYIPNIHSFIKKELLQVF